MGSHPAILALHWWHTVPIIFVYLLLFSVLATSKVISGWIPTCDSAHSWRLCSAPPLGNEAISTMTRYPTQSHYPDTELTNPWPILILLSTWLGNDKYQFNKSLVWHDPGIEPTISRTLSQYSTNSITAPGQISDHAGSPPSMPGTQTKGKFVLFNGISRALWFLCHRLLDIKHMVIVTFL